MTVLDTPRCCIAPFTVEDQLHIREELAYLLDTPHFTGSKRYPAFLKWVVERTLAGKTSDLKERTIGVELFGKNPDYDTSNDTIVRFTAGEVRKRLVLAYHQSDRSPVIRIGLPAGSYVPEFLRSEAKSEISAAESEPAIPSPLQPLKADESLASFATPTFAAARLRGWRVGISVLTVLTVLVTILIVVRGYAAKNDSALSRFWQPVLNSGHPVIIATGAVIPSKDSEYGLTPATNNDRYPYVSLASAATVTHVGGLLEQKRIAYSVLPSSRLTLTDMLQHPVILVGTFNNAWTLRLLANLRFGVTNKHQPGIVDTEDPTRIWRPSWSQGEGNHVRLDDYAIVARYQDKLTQNTVVLVAGLEKNGTEAAAEFVTDSRYLDLLDQTQPRDWSSKNIEIVIRAKVVDGQSGAPEIVAVYTW
jgi:hypothetical protein